MAENFDVATVLRAIRATLDLTQEQVAERLGVSFASVNRWEGGGHKPQKALKEAILALAREAGVDPAEDGESVAEAAAQITRRRTGRAAPSAATTKPMEQMLWDAACSIRGEKEAAKFKDYLLPLLFLKRLSDVFEDEIQRLAEERGDRAAALKAAEAQHSLVRFYLPPEARWAAISEPDGESPNDGARDIGQRLTQAVRATVRHNPTLSGVIDMVDFAAERSGEREINPAKLRGVVDIFSDPRYRMGLADVQPDFLGRAYEYLLRKFAEGSGQSAGEFFTPTEVGLLMAHILRPRPGETCHDYACGSAGLLIKLQLVAKELDPTSRAPLKLSGQELQAESYAVAQMNALIHDMDVELARGDTMNNPKFLDANGGIRQHDIVVANPMWNQPIEPDRLASDPFKRFLAAGGVASGKGDWAWLQHTLACLDEHGRAAVVLDTGAVTRGSGSRNDDKERNIRKWFVDNDLIDGVILLPENLFYNTTAAGVIVVLNKRKHAERKGKITLLNASRRFRKGRPKSYLLTEDLKPLAVMYLKGEPVEGELAVITRRQIEDADYNLSPSRWIVRNDGAEKGSISTLKTRLDALDADDAALSNELLRPLRPLLVAPDVLTRVLHGDARQDTELGLLPQGWVVERLGAHHHVGSGGTPSRSVPAYWVGGDIPWVKTTEVNYCLIQKTEEHITRQGLKNSAAKLLQPGTVLMAMYGQGVTRGKVAILGIEAACNQACAAITPIDDAVSPRYLYHFLRWRYEAIRALAHGGQQQNLNLDIVRDLPIAYPKSMEEQAGLVGVLDALDRKVELQRRKLDVLEEMHQSLLQQLMSGDIQTHQLDLDASRK